MPPGVKREQGAGLESQTNTRQDRGIVLMGGGTITWDAGTSTLTWTASMKLHVPSLGAFTILAGSQATISATGSAVYVVISRATGGSNLATAVALWSAAAFLSDERVILAERGPDDKLYFRNGTVFDDGDVKAFGSLTSSTDRSELISTGVALNSTTFNYAIGTDQLAVYVGGILQKNTLHYVETDATHVTFQAGYIPTAGELISFLNIVGGEGPAGAAGSLQNAYDGGPPTVDVVPGTPVQLDSTTGAGTTILEQAGNAASVGGLAAWHVRRDGKSKANERLARSAGGDTSERADAAGNHIVASTTAPYNGIRVDLAGGIEHGTFPPGGPDVVYGALRWRTYSGTTSAVAPTTIATGLTSSIKGVLVAVKNIVTGKFQTVGFATPLDATAQMFVTFDDATGDVAISLNVDGTGTLPVNLQTQPYRLVVFY